MTEGAAIVGALIVLAVFVVIGTLIGAIILRAAVALYNKFAGGPGSPSAVHEPSMGKAMGITFVTSLVNAVFGFVLGVLVGGAAAASGARGSGVGLIGQVLSLPVSILVMASMLSALLPTTFGRGILVALCHLVIVIIIVGAVVMFSAVVMRLT